MVGDDDGGSETNKESEPESDGDIIGKEIFLSSNSDAEGSVDEKDIQEVEERIEQLKLAEIKLKKKKEHKRLVREAERMEKELKRLEKGSKKSKKAVVTSKSLRGMDEVVKKVDKLMDKKLKVKSVTLSSESGSGESSSSSSSSTGSSSSEDSDDEVTRKSSAKKKREKKDRKESSEKRKHKSGKSKRITSYVKYPEDWPHSHLSLHFVSKGKKFEELSIAEFVAGYSTILGFTSGSKRKHRIEHLKEIMYLATKYQWKCVLNYHAACLLEIERGHLKWGDSFQTLQSTTLAGGFLSSNSSRGAVATSVGQNFRSATRSSGEDAGRITFCKGYQRGTCTQTQDHYGMFMGENRLLKHICGNCWLISKKVNPHSENSDVCPLKSTQSGS